MSIFEKIRRLPWQALPEQLRFPDDESVRVIPLGGLGEVGMNLMVYETRGRILVVDCGTMFPGDDYLGTQFLIPDITYLKENAERVEAIFLTHGHEDHIGAIPFVLNEGIRVPIYGTRLTLGLLRSKLTEWNLNVGNLCELAEAGERYHLGPFEVETIPVTHSIPDALALAITTPAGVLFHTGDFKIDESPPGKQRIDLGRIGEIGDTGVLAMLSDSTNIGNPGRTGSELKVGPALEDLMRGHDGRVFVATFSTNVDRVQQILYAAHASGRRAALIGRSLQSVSRVARQLGFLKHPPKTLTNPDKLESLEPAQVCYVVTGSQGERSSALSRIARGEHSQVDLSEGDLIIFSARAIPGNEDAIGKLINAAHAVGAQVVQDRAESVHVSGHAAREEQRQMIELVRPKFFIPVHGETRMLVPHAELARECGVKTTIHIEDGAVLRVTPEGAEIEGRVPAGPVAVDSGTGALLEQQELHDRHFLGNHGLLVATVTIDRKKRAAVGLPRFEMRGLAMNGHTDDALTGVVNRAISEYYQDGSDYDSLEEALIQGLRRHWRKHSSTMIPYILPVVIEQHTRS